MSWRLWGVEGKTLRLDVRPSPSAWDHRDSGQRGANTSACLGGLGQNAPGFAAVVLLSSEAEQSPELRITRTWQGWSLCGGARVAPSVLVRDWGDPGQAAASPCDAALGSPLLPASVQPKPFPPPAPGSPPGVAASRNSCPVAVPSPFWDWGEEGGLEQPDSLLVASWGGAGFNNVPECVAVLGHV